VDKHVQSVEGEGSPVVIVNGSPEREKFVEEEINNCKLIELAK
jgi:purine-nucleoside phosphorylase